MMPIGTAAQTAYAEELAATALTAVVVAEPAEEHSAEQPEAALVSSIVVAIAVVPAVVPAMVVVAVVVVVMVVILLLHVHYLRLGCCIVDRGRVIVDLGSWRKLLVLIGIAVGLSLVGGVTCVSVHLFIIIINIITFNMVIPLIHLNPFVY
jgi:hypothetical protein